MPYPPRRPAGRPVRRSGGGGAAYVVAGVFVVGVIGALIAFTSGGEKKKPAPVVVEAPPTAAPAPPPKPEKPAAAPYPAIDPAVIAAAKEIASKLDEPSKRAQALYDEAMAAKRSGDTELWQRKLTEADEILTAIQDDWNERVEGRIRPGNGYQEDQIANHYIGPESTKFNKAMMLKAAIRKSRTM